VLSAFPARGRGHSARILTPALSTSFSSPTIRSNSASAPAMARFVRSANRRRPSCSRSCAALRRALCSRPAPLRAVASGSGRFGRRARRDQVLPTSTEDGQRARGTARHQRSGEFAGGARRVHDRIVGTSVAPRASSTASHAVRSCWHAGLSRSGQRVPSDSDRQVAGQRIRGRAERDLGRDSVAGDGVVVAGCAPLVM
jgi:hypothetical protein